MIFASTKALFLSIFEQWSDHDVLNYRKSSLKTALSPDTNYYQIGSTK